MGVATLAKVICGVDQVYWAVLWLRLTNLDERCRAALVVVAVPSCCCALFLLLLLLSLSRCQQRAVVFFFGAAAACHKLFEVTKLAPSNDERKPERERQSREKRKWRQAALRLWRPRKNKTAHNLISTIPQRRNAAAAAAASCGCYRSPGIIITFNGK